MDLSGKAQRVLGALLEKCLTTPDGYPLSLNGLRTACNQKSARDPVVSYLDADVQQGIAELKEHGLVLTKYSHGSRVPKYAHLAGEKLDFTVGQQAALAVLLLRGPLTVGEVNTRTARLHDFATLGEVDQTLEALAVHKFGSFAEKLPRAPGQKEERWRHLLGAVQESTATATVAALEETANLQAEIEELRRANAQLVAEVAQLQSQLDELTAP